MTITAKCLVEASALSSAVDTTLYTAPTGTRTYLDKITVTNTNAANQTISVNIVASAGAVGTTNLLTKSQSITAGSAYTFPELVGQVLNAGDFISMNPSATGLNVRISGREMA